MPRGRPRKHPLPVEITPVGTLTIPARPEAELLPVEECADHLWKAIHPLLKTKVDLATFRVRPGVTLVADREGDPVVEVFLREKVKGVTCKRISGVVARGTIDVFVRDMIEDLQSRHSWDTPQVTYRRVEVLREILYELEDLLPDGNPEVTEFEERSPAYYRRKIDLIRKRIQDRLKESQG